MQILILGRNMLLTQKRLKNTFSNNFPFQFRINYCKKELKLFELKKNSSVKKHCFEALKNSYKDKKAKIEEMKQKIEKRILFNCTMGLAKMVMRKDKRINELQEVKNHYILDYQRIKREIIKNKTSSKTSRK